MVQRSVYEKVLKDQYHVSVFVAEVLAPGLVVWT